MSFTLLGFALIIVAWGIQLIHSWNHDTTLSRTFVAMYGVGLVSIILDKFFNPVLMFTMFDWLHILTLLLVVMVLVRGHK